MKYVIKSFIESLKGKPLSEKSSLMAEAWRALDDSEKERFIEVDESMDDTLGPSDKKKVLVRVAKRHQGDVCLSKL